MQENDVRELLAPLEKRRLIRFWSETPQNYFYEGLDGPIILHKTARSLADLAEVNAALKEILDANSIPYDGSATPIDWTSEELERTFKTQELQRREEYYQLKKEIRNELFALLAIIIGLITLWATVQIDNIQAQTEANYHKEMRQIESGFYQYQLKQANRQ